MWKTIKEYWEILLGFVIAIIGAIVLTGGKNRKTQDKLNKQNRKDNKKINKIQLDRNKKIAKVIEDHEEVLEELAKNKENDNKQDLEKVNNHKDKLKSKTNQELADLFNKE